VLFHIVFAIKYTTFRLRLKENELKYLFEPRVNFMTECEAAARYDAIHVNNWKSILVGAFLTPVRVSVAVVVVLIQWVYVNIQAKIYGGKLGLFRVIVDFL
jgi:hypothetical protein